MLHRLPYGNDSFDFVHQRLLVLGIPLTKWPEVVGELARVTRPGGWIELVECDLNFEPGGSYTRNFVNWLDETSRRRGIDISIGTKTKSFLEKVGLSCIEEKTQALAIGEWGGRLGTMLLSDVSAAAKQTIRPIILNTLNIDPAIYDFTVDAWLQECERYRQCCRFSIVYGKKEFWA